MTLRELFQQSSIDSTWLLYYFISIPFICLVLMLLFNNPNSAYKIKWLLAILCFLVVIPGIFSLTFNIYTFLFERQSLLDMNLILQGLPVISMVASLILIKKTLPFEYIPGFEKLTKLSTIIFILMAFMWLVDRTHIFAFSMIPFSYIIIGFVAIVLFLRFGMSRLL